MTRETQLADLLHEIMSAIRWNRIPECRYDAAELVPVDAVRLRQKAIELLKCDHRHEAEQPERFAVRKASTDRIARLNKTLVFFSMIGETFTNRDDAQAACDFWTETSEDAQAGRATFHVVRV